MTVCPECLQDIPLRQVQWERLLVTEDCALWDGEHIRLSAVKTRMLFVLARTGRASHFAMQSALSDKGDLDVHMHQLRKRLREAGVPFHIERVRGFGYRLELIELSQPPGAVN